MLPSTIALLFGTQVLRIWSLTSADTKINVLVENNQLSILALEGVTEKRVWCQNSNVALIDHIWKNGEQTNLKWKFKSGDFSKKGSRLVLLFENTAPSLTLKSIWTAHPGPGPVEHHIEILNHTNERITVPQQESLELSGIRPGSKADIWWVRRGASNALTEGGTYQEPVRPGLDLNLESNHQDPRSPVPWLALQIGHSRGLYLGWEYSSLGRLRASETKPNSVTFKAGLLPNFKTDILPHQAFVVPTAFVGCYQGDIDQGSARLHKFVLANLRHNPAKSFPDPCLIYNLYLDAGSDKATEKDVLRCLDFAKGVGAEVFMPDAMWFPGCGDWRWDSIRFPNGGRAMSEAAHRAGLWTSLWCAWTNGGVSSDPGALSVRGPYGHPDWFWHNLPETWQPGPFYGAKADMASPEAKAWEFKKTQSLVGDLELDLLKTDCDPMINDCVQKNHRHSYDTDVSYWSTQGVYDVWDNLLAKFPKLVLENCSGASHIKDFGVIQRCAYTAVTDTLSNLPDRAGIYDSTFVLPPSALLTYTYERGYGLPGDDPGTFLFRSAMMTAWSLDPTNSKAWTDEEKAACNRSTKIFKGWLRPILKDCEVHHVLPRPNGKRWDGLFLWNPSLTKGTLFVFRPDAPEAVQSVRLAGLDPVKRYRIWSEDGSIATDTKFGTELMDQGLKINLPTRYCSDLIHVQSTDASLPDGWTKASKFNLARPDISNNAFGNTTDLRWSASNANGYRVVVSRKPDLSNPFINTVCYTTHVSLRQLDPAQKVFWQVTALSYAGNAVTSVGSFRPLPKKPWNGAFLSDISWSSANAGSGQVLKDHNYYGNPLSVGGKVLPKGLWTHSFDDGRPADIVVNVEPGRYRLFSSEVGLDDASGGGSVQFQIWLDSKKLIETEVLRPGMRRKLSVGVEQGGKLILRVLNGGDGYISDHAVWGLARLIEHGKPDPLAGW